MACPLFFNSVNIEDSFLLAVLSDITCRCSARQVDKEAHLPNKDFVQDLLVVLVSEAYFDELDLWIYVREMLRIWIYDGHFVEFEVPLDQGDCSSTY